MASIINQVHYLLEHIGTLELIQGAPSEVKGYVNAAGYRYPNYLALVDLGSNPIARNELVHLFNEAKDEFDKAIICKVLQDLKAKELVDFFITLLKSQNHHEIKECAMIALARMGIETEVDNYITSISSPHLSFRTRYHIGIAYTRLRDLRGIDYFIELINENPSDPLAIERIYPITCVWFMRCMFVELRNRGDYYSELGNPFWKNWWNENRHLVKRVRYPKQIGKILAYNTSLRKSPISVEEAIIQLRQKE